MELIIIIYKLSTNLPFILLQNVKSITAWYKLHTILKIKYVNLNSNTSTNIFK